MNSNLFGSAASLLDRVASGETITIAGFHGKRIFGIVTQLEKLEAEHKRFEVVATERYERPGQRIGKIAIITDDIAIIEVLENDEEPKYFYVLGDRASSTYSMDKEIAILNALAEKYDGLNSGFANYACKMLGKEIK